MWVFLSVLQVLSCVHCVTVAYKQEDILSKSKVELRSILISGKLNDIVVLTAPVSATKAIYHLHKPNQEIIKLNIPRPHKTKDRVKVKYYNKNTKILYSDHESKSKVELRSILISGKLNDIVVLTAPVSATKAIYHLHKPNQEIIKLNIPRPHKTKDRVKVKYYNENTKILNSDHESRVLTPYWNDDDIVREAEESIRENEFIIGPLLEEDHGNWVLSIYTKDIDDNWIEMFQVITIEITEEVPLVKNPDLQDGDELHLSFAYPIKDLQTCELSVPRSTYDRFYDRSQVDMDKCGFIIKNITKSDQGEYIIIGVGKVVYTGQINLSFNEKQDQMYNDTGSKVNNQDYYYITT